MASKDDDEITAVVARVLAGIALAVVGVVYAVGGGKTMRAPAASSLEMVDIAPIGEPLAKVYFGVGKAELNEADGAVVGAGVKAASTSRHKSGAREAGAVVWNVGQSAQREGCPARGQRRSVQGLGEDGF
ncbi:hypothetical protein [Accumulibacter sp.]|uniref:hypothetical protein n=1 Tax=Accumulibacter sp. TaxID=2053492 RepID=UPI00261B9C90|nr:hypothetical protein [Accumulibacter sp.]